MVTLWMTDCIRRPYGGGYELMTIGCDDVLAWIAALQQVYAQNRQWLTELDSAIGDADDGAVNMDRGFTAVLAELQRSPPQDIGAALKAVAIVPDPHCRWRFGPLYGTFFLRASSACAGETALQASDLVRMFQAGIEGVQPTRES